MELSFFLLISILAYCAAQSPTEIINKHNQKRHLHQVGDLRLNRNIQAKAERCCRYYAQIDTINHTCKENSGYEENLYVNVGQSDNAFDVWYDESKDYDYSTGTKKRGSENKEILHFTQLVWKKSQQIGCATAKNGNKKFVCCMYSPPGNYKRQYIQNVLRPRNIFDSISMV